MSFLLVCLTRVWSCSYVSPGAMEKSKLRSSGARKCFCVDWFYLWKWFSRTWTKKVCFKKGRSRTWAMVSVWEKDWTHMGVKMINFGELRLILNGRGIFDRKRNVYLVFEYSGKRRMSIQVFLSHPHKKELFYYFCFIKNLIERQTLWTWSRWKSRVPYSGKRWVSAQVFLFWSTKILMF